MSIEENISSRKFSHNSIFSHFTDKSNLHGNRANFFNNILPGLDCFAVLQENHSFLPENSRTSEASTSPNNNRVFR